MNREDLAWAAGFFDGEGSFLIRNQPYQTKAGRKRGKYARASLDHTERDQLVRFQHIIGLGRIDKGHKSKLGKKEIWRWVVDGHEHVQAVGAKLWAWLGVDKASKLAFVLRGVR